MYESGDLKKGRKIEIDGDPYVIVGFEFVKPGKGQALYKCKLKNMITGSQFDRTYRSGEKFKPANLEEQAMEYLYSDGEQYCFMNYSNKEVQDDRVKAKKWFNAHLKLWGRNANKVLNPWKKQNKELVNEFLSDFDCLFNKF